VSPGTHVNLVGACQPHAREADSALIAAGRLYVDSREAACSESGDILIPLEEGAIGEDHIQAEIGEVLLDQRPGRADNREITLFKSLGLAAQDVAATSWVVERARETGRGKVVDL
jgi:ornithine cyclodeaminase